MSVDTEDHVTRINVWLKEFHTMEVNVKISHLENFIVLQNFQGQFLDKPF